MWGPRPSQPYRPPWPVTGTVLPFLFSHVCWKPELWSQKRWALRGNGSVSTFPRLPAHVTTAALTRNRWTRHETSRPPLQCRHAEIEDLWEAVLCGGARRGYIWSIWTQLSQSRECLEADRPVRVWGCCETVAPGGGVEGGGALFVISRCLVTPS
jgi:hypothetical protein